MKILSAIMILMFSVGAFAQGRNGQLDGRIVFSDGRSTVRISVNERSDLNLRIRLLEEAVRDLQAQVYDLRDARQQSRIVTRHACTLITAFDGTFLGKGATRIEADAIARQQCERAGAPFCSTAKVTCESVQEEIFIR